VTAGRLLVFEGAEGAGKSTQIIRLAEVLRARDVPHLVVREPGGTVVGEQLRRLVLDPAQDMDAATEALLFIASRAEHVARVVRPALREGLLVIADRFFLSTYAYQIAGRGLPEEAIRAANALATGGLVPDLTLLLLHRAAEGLARADQRGARDRIERADDAFHERVSAAFERFGEPGWQRSHPECGPILGIDAAGTPHEVFDRVIAAVGERWFETFPVLRGSDRG
jgi:dTMP kinase